MDPDSGAAPRRSPLATVALALLAEEPMHVYRMQALIRERAQDDVVNVGSRNSLHQVVTRLERDGLISAQTSSAASRRTTYALTPRGADALGSWLDDMLARPRNEFPEFPAGLALAVFRSSGALADHLDARAAALRETLASPTPDETAAALGIDPVFLLEDDYKRAMVTAELAWVEALVRRLRSGALSWEAVPMRADG